VHPVYAAIDSTDSHRPDPSALMDDGPLEAAPESDPTQPCATDTIAHLRKTRPSPPEAAVSSTCASHQDVVYLIPHGRLARRHSHFVRRPSCASAAAAMDGGAAGGRARLPHAAGITAWCKATVYMPRCYNVFIRQSQALSKPGDVDLSRIRPSVQEGAPLTA